MMNHKNADRFFFFQKWKLKGLAFYLSMLFEWFQICFNCLYFIRFFIIKLYLH